MQLFTEHRHLVGWSGKSCGRRGQHWMWEARVVKRPVIRPTRLRFAEPSSRSSPKSLITSNSWLPACYWLPHIGWVVVVKVSKLPIGRHLQHFGQTASRQASLALPGKCLISSTADAQPDARFVSSLSALTPIRPLVDAFESKAWRSGSTSKYRGSQMTDSDIYCGTLSS